MKRDLFDIFLTVISIFIPVFV
ncbi:hypothetical protein V12B01_13645 [Vibrio splendidus 12B01]|nr:hypothetical protein V12B01_13645 [Vibrio splendidus 12B01]